MNFLVGRIIWGEMLKKVGVLILLIYYPRLAITCFRM